MDDKQFDRVARVVGEGIPRRRLLSGLLGAVLAGSLGRAATSAKGKRQHHGRRRGKVQANAGPTPKPNGSKCAKNSQCQSGHCCGSRSNRICQVPSCDGKACGADDGCGGTCQTGTCGSNQLCEAGQSKTAGALIDCFCSGTVISGVCTQATCDGSLGVLYVCEPLCSARGARYSGAAGGGIPCTF
jgi:hypothetical protein